MNLDARIPAGPIQDKWSQRCFDAPFAVEGYVLRGGASVGIAMYPEDGTTADSLLRGKGYTLSRLGYDTIAELKVGS